MDQENAKWHRNPSSQYEHFDRLPVLLKRFSFLEKMRIACIYSSKAIKYNPMTDRKVSKPFPWSIEVFVMMSVAGKRFVKGVFFNISQNDFLASVFLYHEPISQIEFLIEKLPGLRTAVQT